MKQAVQVRFDAAGNMFFAEMQNHVVRRVDAKTRVISTVAGTGTAGFSGDGARQTRRSCGSRTRHLRCRGPPVDLRYREPSHPPRRLEVRQKSRRGQGRASASRRRTAHPRGDAAERSRAHHQRSRRATYTWSCAKATPSTGSIRAGKIYHVAGTGENGYTGDGGPAKLRESCRVEGDRLGAGREPVPGGYRESHHPAGRPEVRCDHDRGRGRQAATARMATRKRAACHVRMGST